MFVFEVSLPDLRDELLFPKFNSVKINSPMKPIIFPSNLKSILPHNEAKHPTKATNQASFANL